MKKVVWCLLSCFVAVFLTSGTAYAAASPSDAQKETQAAASSGQLEILAFQEIEDQIAALSSVPSFNSIENTISSGGVRVVMSYYDDNGDVKYTPFVYPTYADGMFDFTTPKLPADVNEFRTIEFNIYSNASMPAPGKYTLNCGFTNAVSGHSIPYALIWSNKANSNAASQSGTIRVNELGDTSGGGACFSQDIEIGTVTAFNICFFLTGAGDTPFSGAFKIGFVPLSADAAVTGTTAGGSYSSDNAASDTASNTGQLVEEQKETNSLIANIIQTISNQLTAFWNQLAGEFTNLYNRLAAQHTEQLKADQENTQNVIQNQTANTATITDGYDASSIDQDNSRLSSKIDEYDQAEKSVLDSVNDSLGSFAFESDLSGFSATVKMVSDFLQAMYDASGGFKLVINLSFMVSIASIVIGMYRFKEGG